MHEYYHVLLIFAKVIVGLKLSESIISDKGFIALFQLKKAFAIHMWGQIHDPLLPPDQDLYPQLDHM